MLTCWVLWANLNILKQTNEPEQQHDKEPEKPKESESKEPEKPEDAKRKQAIEILKKNGKAVTENNIDYVAKQPPD